MGRGCLAGAALLGGLTLFTASGIVGLVEADRAANRSVRQEFVEVEENRWLDFVDRALSSFDSYNDYKKGSRMDIFYGVDVSEIPTDKLMSIVSEESGGMASMVLEELGKRGVRDVLPYALDALDDDRYDKFGAIKALGYLGGPEAERALIRMSEKYDNWWTVRDAVRKALVMTGGSEEALLHYLESENKTDLARFVRHNYGKAFVRRNSWRIANVMESELADPCGVYSDDLYSYARVLRELDPDRARGVSERLTMCHEWRNSSTYDGLVRILNGDL